MTFKGPISGVRQFLTTESLLQMMKNVFSFLLKALFVLKMFTFLSWLFDYAEKRLDKKIKVNLKIYEVTDWTANNYNIHFAQSQKLKAIRQRNLIS